VRVQVLKASVLQLCDTNKGTKFLWSQTQTLKFYGHIHYRYRHIRSPLFQEQVLLMRNTEPATHAVATVCSGLSARAPLHQLQPVESKGAATQDNETTSGAKAGTESQQPHSRQRNDLGRQGRHRFTATTQDKHRVTATTQDNETTSGAKAGTESQQPLKTTKRHRAPRPAPSHTDPPTIWRTTWRRPDDHVAPGYIALSRTKLFNNRQGKSEYIYYYTPSNQRICLQLRDPRQ